MSAEEDSTSSPDDDPYDDTDILNSAGTDEVTAHLAAAGESCQRGETEYLVIQMDPCESFWPVSDSTFNFCEGLCHLCHANFIYNLYWVDEAVLCFPFLLVFFANAQIW